MSFCNDYWQLILGMYLEGAQKKEKKEKKKKKKKERNQVTSSEPFHSHLSMAVYVDMFASASDVWKLEEVALSPV